MHFFIYPTEMDFRGFLTNIYHLGDLTSMV